MKLLAVIPARGGSKGVPRKNLRIVAGAPLICHMIRAVLGAEVVDRVVVSTEDAEIAHVSRLSGAEIVHRPVELAGDDVSSESVVMHVLEHLKHLDGYEPDVVLLAQCTSPLTEPDDVSGIIDELTSENADSAFSATEFRRFVWARRENAVVAGVNHDPEFRLRRQDVPPNLLENGALYAMRHSGFIQTGNRFFGKIAVYEMPASRSLEVDEPEDIEIADVLLRDLQRNRRILMLPESIRALVLDFDGVFTDNSVIVGDEGTESVICSRADGYGISMMKSLGVTVLVLSTEASPVVSARCRKLDIECIQQVDDKRVQLLAWLETKGIDAHEVVYVGNDLNDVGALSVVGCGVAVADAEKAASRVARIVLDSRGGHGAIREIADMIARRLNGE